MHRKEGAGKMAELLCVVHYIRVCCKEGANGRRAKMKRDQQIKRMSLFVVAQNDSIKRNLGPQNNRRQQEREREREREREGERETSRPFLV